MHLGVKGADPYPGMRARLGAPVHVRHTLYLAPPSYATVSREGAPRPGVGVRGDPAMGTRGSAATRGGGDGLHNEDAFVVDEGLGLYVVCDGESAKPAGEIAARIAAESVADVIGARCGSTGSTAALDESVVEEALRAAVNAVARAGESSPDLAGLSTTVSVLVVHRSQAVVGHRGDSCVYLIRDGRVSRLTGDHEWTSQRDSERTSESGQPDFEIFASDVEPGDTLVLCSDGAAAALDDPLIPRVAGDLSPSVLASRIVSAANRLAPDQDSTAVIVRVLPARRPGWLSLSGPPSATRFGHLVHGWREPAEDRDGPAARLAGSAEEGD